MDGRLFLLFTVVISAGLFLNGLRFSRMTENPFDNRKIFGIPIQGAGQPVSHLNRIGRLQMIFAPVFLIFVAAICFGLFSPVDGITTISLN